jgi:hypothetical protein
VSWNAVAASQAKCEDHGGHSWADPSEMTDEVSLAWLIKSLAHGVLDGLRRNKLAALLATVIAGILIPLAVNSRFEGLQQYQEFILPRLLRLERGFLQSLRAAENASGEWRLYYFENAHRDVNDILRAARLDRPQGYVARRKHRSFIRYYESLDSAFHDISIEMRTNPDVDYIDRLRKRLNERKALRDAWEQWAIPAKNGS